MELSHGETSPEVIRVQRWPTELVLRFLVAILALGIWVLMAFSIIGIVYAVLIGIFLFTTHLALIAHVRGSAVKLRPEQFPELHRRVQTIASQAGLRRPPDAYLMQAGGALNAFATKFLGTHLLVLYSDLLDACDGDDAARDMVIAHEIGHVRCGHLRWRWLLFPGLLVPFVGSAYSRACEYTCDRYGAALCGDPRGALRGLAILSAGGHHARAVNLEALVAQRQDLDTGFMTLGTWLATHPPLSQRMAALDPSLGATSGPSARGMIRALGIIALLLMVPFLGAYALGRFGHKFIEQVKQAQTGRIAPAPQPKPLGASEIVFARNQVAEDFTSLAAVAETFRKEHGRLPADDDALYDAWDEEKPNARVPHDPFDGHWYGYGTDGRRFWLWSVGPDMKSNTKDDIEFSSPEH
ncbi:MAG TPA: M48 family metallopeptidase [Candidatus Polarisedimenticolaceae bacterium]|nr:M48 family metallopeptidase [Candidatus Polarisedimenticolaceae bacterium]